MGNIKKKVDNFTWRLQRNGYQPADIHPATASVEKVVQMEQMKRYIMSCTDCSFHEHCRNRVPGTGLTRSPFMIVGEGPGEDEEQFAMPLVGISGTLMTLILHKMGLSREMVYITNVMKCRVSDEQGKNRKPKQEETHECSKFLKAEIQLVRPKAILALGKVSLQYFFPEMTSMSKARGQAYDYGQGIKVIPTWHPSYVLRQRGEDESKVKKEVWHDYRLALHWAKNSS